jgi:hypothetical protein
VADNTIASMSHGGVRPAPTSRPTYDPSTRLKLTAHSRERRAERSEGLSYGALQPAEEASGEGGAGASSALRRAEVSQLRSLVA